jgi:hypothetical protein
MRIKYSFIYNLGISRTINQRIKEMQLSKPNSLELLIPPSRAKTEFVETSCLSRVTCPSITRKAKVLGLLVGSLRARPHLDFGLLGSLLHSSLSHNSHTFGAN